VLSDCLPPSPTCRLGFRHDRAARRTGAFQRRSDSRLQGVRGARAARRRHPGAPLPTLSEWCTRSDIETGPCLLRPRRLMRRRPVVGFHVAFHTPGPLRHPSPSVRTQIPENRPSFLFISARLWFVGGGWGMWDRPTPHSPGRPRASVDCKPQPAHQHSSPPQAQDTPVTDRYGAGRPPATYPIDPQHPPPPASSTLPSGHPLVSTLCPPEASRTPWTHSGRHSRPYPLTRPPTIPEPRRTSASHEHWAEMTPSRLHSPPPLSPLASDTASRIGRH